MPIIIAIVAIAFIGGAVYLFTTGDTTSTPATVAKETPARAQDSGGSDEMNMEDDSTTDDETGIDASAEAEISTFMVDEVLGTSADAAAGGTFTATGNYLTPARTTHEIAVTLTLADGLVTDAEVMYDGGAGYSNPNQERFDGAYKAEVIGKPIDAISLSRVGGASLTSGAFNEAVVKIAAQI